MKIMLHKKLRSIVRPPIFCLKPFKKCIHSCTIYQTQARSQTDVCCSIIVKGTIQSQKSLKASTNKTVLSWHQFEIFS